MIPIWLSVGRAFVGVRETPGTSSNPAIMQWATDIGAPKWYDSDAKAWCAVWLNRLMLACQLPMAGSGYDLLRAKSFETWGQPLPAPALGSVLVFSRPEGAHVGLYVGERPDAFRVLGANQGDAVNETWIAKTRLTAVRWPTGVALPTSGPVTLQVDGEVVSEDEA